MKKITLALIITSLFILSACNTVSESKEPTTETPEQQESTPEEKQIESRDIVRKQNVHNFTVPLGQLYRENETYPEADKGWCADKLIESFVEQELMLQEIEDPEVQTIDGLECKKSGIYYFFRGNDPDAYTVGIKLESDKYGNSNFTPLEVAKLSKEELGKIRLGENKTGQYYYIIGNFYE